MNPKIRTFMASLIACAVIGSATTSLADVVYADFGAAASCGAVGSTFNCINQHEASMVFGPRGYPYVGYGHSVAVSFKPSSAFFLTQVQLPLVPRSANASYAVYLTTDNDGKPGDIVASWTHVTSSLSYPTSASIALSAPAGVVLVGGVTYWLAVGADDPAASAFWVHSWQDTIDSQGADAVETSTTLLYVDSDFSSGLPTSGWREGPATGGPRPAFEIDGRPLVILPKPCGRCLPGFVCDRSTGKCCNPKLPFCQKSASALGVPGP